MFNIASGQTKIIGWDIGGAHLKAVVLDANATQLNCIQLPCPLWRGLNELKAAIGKIFSLIGLRSNEAIHAVTMTGELVDLFANRHTGVCEIAQCAVDFLGQNTFFYAANNAFVQIEQVVNHTSQIASTNWHASASLLALHVQDALLIDIGSTTSDIIPIAHSQVAMHALSDASRMQQDTLVYTGVVRTPIMAIAQKVSIIENDQAIEMNVAAEFFATMADVYRLTGELAVEQDMAETADGKGKTQQESARRLARMVGCDVEDKTMKTWISLAFSFRTLQLNQLKNAILKHLKPNTPIIGAGAGSFLVKVLAAELGCEYRLLSDILQADFLSSQSLNLEPLSSQFLKLEPLDKNTPSHLQQANLEMCLPAYAVARLALNNPFIKKAMAT